MILVFRFSCIGIYAAALILAFSGCSLLVARAPNDVQLVSVEPVSDVERFEKAAAVIGYNREKFKDPKIFKVVFATDSDLVEVAGSTILDTNVYDCRYSGMEGVSLVGLPSSVVFTKGKWVYNLANPKYPYYTDDPTPYAGDLSSSSYEFYYAVPKDRSPDNLCFQLVTAHMLSSSKGNIVPISKNEGHSDKGPRIATCRRRENLLSQEMTRRLNY